MQPAPASPAPAAIWGQTIAVCERRIGFVIFPPTFEGLRLLIRNRPLDGNTKTTVY